MYTPFSMSFKSAILVLISWTIFSKASFSVDWDAILAVSTEIAAVRDALAFVHSPDQA